MPCLIQRAKENLSAALESRKGEHPTSNENEGKENQGPQPNTAGTAIKLIAKFTSSARAKKVSHFCQLEC